MGQKRKLNSFYKRKLYGGRSALARFVDFTALRAVAAAACYLYFTTIVSNTLLALILSASSMMFVSLAAEMYKGLKLDAFKEAYKGDMKKQLLRERLLKLPYSEFTEHVRSAVMREPERFGSGALIHAIQQTAPISSDTVLTVYRTAVERGCNAAYIFAVSEPEEAVKSILRRSEIVVRFEALDALMLKEDSSTLIPDDDAVEAAITTEMHDERQRRKEAVSSPFAAVRIRRYLIIAALLFAASFFVKYTLYYRLLSAACISFGAIAWWLGSIPNGEKA